MRRSKLTDQALAVYLPEGCVEPVLSWFNSHPVILRITRGRKTKLGDFRSGTASSPPVISINNNLNPYRFLVTLLHEMAHAAVFFNYKRRVMPHGSEWKAAYQKIGLPYLQKGLLPEDVRSAFYNYLINPKASSLTDMELEYVLKYYDTKQEGMNLFGLPEGSLFAIPDGRVFLKGLKRRKLYQCECLTNGKTYLFNPMAVVTLLDEEESLRYVGKRVANLK